MLPQAQVLNDLIAEEKQIPLIEAEKPHRLIQALDFVWNALFYAKMVREVGPGVPAQERHEFEPVRWRGAF